MSLKRSEKEKGKEEEGVDITTLSSTAMGRGLCVFRREKRAIVCVVILESNFKVSLSGLHSAHLKNMNFHIISTRKIMLECI